MILLNSGTKGRRADIIYLTAKRGRRSAARLGRGAHGAAKLVGPVGGPVKVPVPEAQNRAAFLNGLTHTVVIHGKRGGVR